MLKGRSIFHRGGADGGAMTPAFTAAVAHSEELVSHVAVAELIESCEKQLDGQVPTAGLLFAGIDVDHQVVLDGFAARWPRLQLIGCTTDGELSSAGGYAEDSIVVALFASDTLRIVSGWVDNTAEHLGRAVDKAYGDAVARLGETPQFCILISDAQHLSGESVLEKLSRAAAYELPIVGGISADSWRFEQSKQFHTTTISDAISPFLLFAGPLAYSFGIDSGWEAIGEMGTVTRAEGPVVYEIDHLPALDFYRRALGESAVPSMELPAAVYAGDGRFRFLRTSLENYDRHEGSVTFLGDIAVGSHVSMTVVSRDSIIAGVTSAVDDAVAGFPSGSVPSLVLCFTCSARRALLGSRTCEEQQQVAAAVGAGIPVAGFYTYGEFCPRVDPLACEFHNETFVAVLLG